MMKWKRRRNDLTKILLFLSVFFILPVCTPVFSAEENSAARKPPGRIESTDIKWLVFSPTKYRHERALVEKYEHISKRQSNGGHIYIALEDLNGDGTKEIFAYIDIFEFCGQIGCAIGIYQIRDNKLVSLLPPEFEYGGFPIFIDIDKEGRQKVFGILQSKTLGWKDISLEGKTVWKWNGRNY